MDLSKLNTAQLSDEGVEMQLRHPVNGELLDCWITLCGQDSRVHRQKRKEIRSKAMKQKIEDAVEASEQHAMDLRIASTLGWRGLEIDGKEFKYSADNAVKLYSDPGFDWLVNQVDRFMGDRANFLPKA